MMKKVLFIRPDTREDGKVWWCESGSEQVEYLTGWHALNELSCHALSQQVCLLLPASDTIFRQFTLPKKGISAQAAPFSWMAEETLLGEVETLHWTVLNKKGADVDAVAIDAERLRHWLTLFAGAGLKVVQALPDAYLLPVSEGGSSLVSLEDNFWLRFSPCSASESDAVLLPLLMKSHPAGDVRCYGDAPQGVLVDEHLEWQHPLVLIQPQWQRCRVNLLHGEFSTRPTRSAGFQHLNTVITAAALLCIGLLIGPRVGMAWMLTHQQNEIRQEMITVAQHYFPSLHQTTNLKYFVGQNIGKAKKGVFLQLEALNQIKQSLPALEINNVEYDETQNQLTLNVTSMDKQALQEFVARSADTFEFTMQPISGDAPYTAIISGNYK